MGKIINKFIEWAIPKFIEYKSEAIITIAVGVIMWIIALLQSIPLFYRIPIILFVILCVLLIFQLVVRIYDRFTNPVVLEIIYNNGAYNEIKEKVITQENHRELYHFLYRIGIHNISRQTIYSVSVYIEGEMELIKVPRRIVHSHTKQYNCDINPNVIELFDLFYVGNENDFKEKKLTIIVSGKDASSVKREITL